jgi:hypothetical protein
MVSEGWFLKNLLILIEHTEKFKILSFSDSKRLANLFSKKKLYISAHTIARLYGVIKPHRKPYKETLNILAQFSGYLNWDDYYSHQIAQLSQKNYFKTEENSGFSMSLLQLGLVNEDWEVINNLLKKTMNLRDNHDNFYSISQLLGHDLRKSRQQDKLAEQLANSKQGRVLFYECFVDEDDPNGYYSSALQKYYLPTITECGKKLFAISYLLSQSTYKGICNLKLIEEFKSISNLSKNTDLHFHEISRCFESEFIIAGWNNALETKIDIYLNHLIEKIKPYPKNQKIWLLARATRAIIYFGGVHQLLNNSQYNQEIDKLFINDKLNNYKCIGLYILQLYFIYKATRIKSDSSLIKIPQRIWFTDFLNNENEKLAIEFTMAYLFSEGQQKQNIQSKLVQFCEDFGNRWVLPLIHD